MRILMMIGYCLLAYLVGSIPWGYLIVKITTGRNIQQIESGRTGGTNTMRAAGMFPGIITISLDTLKSAGVVWLGIRYFSMQYWLHVAAAFLVVLGHNYSIYLIRKKQEGNIRFGGGAGGTPALGGLIGFWWPLSIIIIPIGMMIFFIVGYASIATMTMPLIGSIILAYRAYRFGTPWEYAVFGLLAEGLIIWALRPNIRRLINGTERVVGIRAKQNEDD